MRLVGIATFSAFVETSFNRITCEFSGACCVLGPTTTGAGVIVRPPLLRAKIRPATQRLTSGRDKVRPARHLFGVCETKLSLQGQNPEKWAIFGEQGEFCLGSAAEGGLLGEFCTGEIAKKACRESFVPEALLKAVTVSVSMCGRSPCGSRSLAGTNFACNSPQGISSFELEPLKFCCFRAVVHVASAGIACDFLRAGEVCFDRWPRDGMWPEGAALTHAATYGGERRVRHGSLRLTAAGRRARPQRMAGAPCSSVTMR